MEDRLQQLGLSQNEAKIYRFLAAAGRRSVTDIAHAIGVSRRNVYDALTRLLDRGLAFKVLSGKESFYEAVNPDKLREIVLQKQQILEDLLPELRALYAKEPHEEENYIYKGIEGLKNCLTDILVAKEPVYTFGAKGFWFDPRVEDFTRSLLQQAAAAGITFRHIFDEDVKREFPKVLESIPKPHKFFPPSASTQGCAIVFGNRVVTFVGVEPGRLGEDLTLFVLVSRAVANSYKKWFCCLWDLLPD